LHGKRVLLVADDQSRPTRVACFFRPVRDSLVTAGVRLDNIEILFALGVHRPMSQQEAEAKIGKDNLAPHRWHNHDCFDPSQLIRLGTTTRGTPVLVNQLLTQFDLIVLLGVIEPHLLLGFSGLKMILPGCAGKETIGRNHLQGMSAACFNYVGAAADDSPMRLDLEEGVQLLPKEIFLVNAVLNHEAEVIHFYCGDPLQAFRTGASFVHDRGAVQVPEQADVVITNSRPFDADLRQGLKCLGNTLQASRPGGLMLGFLYCEQGVGDLPTPSLTLPYPVLRTLLRLLGPKRVPCFSRWASKKEPVEQQFLDQLGLRMLHRNHLWCYSDHLDPAATRKLGVLRQYTSVDNMMAAAERKAGGSATVAVFPFGGASYFRRRDL
jgi:nickel-dependent lactate racemase